MKNYYIISQKRDLSKKIDTLIKQLVDSHSTSFAVVDIDFDQKEKLILAEKGKIRYTLMNHVDLGMVDYFMNVHLTKGKNLTELIVIENIEGLSKNEMDYFEQNIKKLNLENIYLIFCSNKAVDSRLIDIYFEKF